MNSTKVMVNASKVLAYDLLRTPNRAESKPEKIAMLNPRRYCWTDSAMMVKPPMTISPRMSSWIRNLRLRYRGSMMEAKKAALENPHRAMLAFEALIAP